PVVGAARAEATALAGWPGPAARPAHGTGHGQCGGGLRQPVAVVALAEAGRCVPTPARLGTPPAASGGGVRGDGDRAVAGALGVAGLDCRRIRGGPVVAS